MLVTFALAVVLSQAPDDQMSPHVINNIKNALRTSSCAAVVTVRSAEKDRVVLDVNESVVGTLPAELDVTVRAFNKRDLEAGTKLLVFFRGSGTALVPTGNYELAFDGKIREYPLETYVARTKLEATKLPKAKPAAPAKPAAAPSAPVSAAPATPHAGS